MNFDTGAWQDETDAGDPGSPVAARRRRLIIVFGAIFVVVAVLAFVFGRGHKPAPPAAPAPTVTVIVPGRVSVADSITATGTLQAKRDMPVGVAGEGGMVSRVLVDAGDWVRAGQTLATVDPEVQAAQTSQMAAQISSAQANAKLAQSQLDRAQALVSRGFISKADIDSRTAARDAASANVKLAQAQYREMSARLNRLDIRAPAAGLVLTRNIEAGQIISSGSPALFRIAMDGIFEMQARLAEQDLAAVHVGMPVTVTPIGGAQSFQGSIWQVSPIIDPTSRQGVARIQLAYNAALRPGGFASASLSAQRTTAPVLPESAVLSDAQGNYVYLIDGSNHVVRRPVKVGDVSDTGVAVLSGLQGNERVVYSAGAFLTPGQAVTPDLKHDD
jgi:RND family efflux transporter MFP subunit